MDVMMRDAVISETTHPEASGFTRIGPIQPHRVNVAGIPVDRVSMEEAAQWFTANMGRRGKNSPLMIVASNAQVVTLASRNQRFSEALQSAHLNIPDGMSVVLASRLLGLPIGERVPCGELMERLCSEAALQGFSVFFLGGLPGAAAKAGDRMGSLYPGFRLAGFYCPKLGFENDPVESKIIGRLIAECAPDLLCVALGAPKQELWMLENCPSLPIGAAMAVGAALDTCSGLRRRAPRWTHNIGLEWLYRLILEPKRLWRRYLIGNAHFVALIGWQIAEKTLAHMIGHKYPLLEESPETSEMPADQGR